MAQQADTEQDGDTKQRRGRGPTKPFPLLTFEVTLTLAEGIMEHGVNGEIQRLTLFSKLGLSPSSSKTRELITNSSKYGLTSGSYKASSLSVTDNGQIVVGADHTPQEVVGKKLELAIKQFEPFGMLYAKLEDQRLPEGIVLQDELGNVGISDADRQKAAEVFVANIRYLGLIQDINGQDYVRNIEQVAEQLPAVESSEGSNEELAAGASLEGEPAGNTVQGPDSASSPSLHIDVQIHIDSSATLDQIDHIFESMARHLYGREG